MPHTPMAATCAAVCLTPLIAVAHPASAQTITTSIAAGVDYSVGDFDLDEETTLIAAPISARAKWRDWSLQAASSYVSVDGPAIFDGENVVGGLGGSGAAGGEQAFTDEQIEAFCALPQNVDRLICQLRDTRGEDGDGSVSGYSDLILTLARGVRLGPDGDTALTLAGGVKVPTGEEDKGLSTGATDGRFRVTVDHPLGTDFFATGTLGYVIRGDSDETEFNNTVALQAGVGGYLGDTWVYSVEADYRQASIDDVDDAVEAGVYLTNLIHRRVAVVGYGYAGLTEASPDFGVGLSLSVQLTP